MQKIEIFSSFIIPTIILIASFLILASKKDCFSSFLKGARDGAKSAISLLPTLCALVVAISLFNASGACEVICKLLAPLCELLHIPSDILPLIITRPLSGGASIATYEDIISRCGVDSYEAICASIIMASSDTVFYVIGIYFSSVGIRKTRWALPCALFVSGICIFISCAIGRFFF